LIEKFFHFIYNTAIINIIRFPETIEIYVEIIDQKEVKQNFNKTFVLNDSYSTSLLEDYLKQFVNETPYYYIALYDNSMDQGAIPTCNKQKIPLYKDLSTAQYLCVDNKWICYTSKIDLEEELEILGSYKADFIFSPFLILYKFFADKIPSKIALYILIKEDAITLAVFKESQLLYGDHVNIAFAISHNDFTLDTEKEEDPLLEEAISESIDLDSIDLDDDLSLDDDLESLDDLDDLDDISDLDDANDLEEQLEENLEEATISNKEEDTTEEIVNENATQDFQYFSIIQNSLARYYKEDIYESDFIENVYVADSVRVTNEFKKYLQEEMFFNVYIRSIELELELSQLTKEELGLRDV
jgi:hypothetical protein